MKNKGMCESKAYMSQFTLGGVGRTQVRLMYI